MDASLHDNESILFRQVATGNEKAFRVIYNRYRNQVFYFGLKFLRSAPEAEDLLQEVFSKIWVNRETLTGIVDFSKYLNTLTLNHIYNLLRRKAFEESFFQEKLFNAEPGLEDAFDSVELHELEGLIKSAVVQLPPQQRKVFELSRLQGMKHDEIAQQLNISKETVKKHIMEALRNVKSYLADKGEIVVTSWIIFFILR